MRLVKFLIVALVTIGIEFGTTWLLANVADWDYIYASYLTTPIITLLIYLLFQEQDSDGGSALSRVIDAAITMDSQLRVSIKNHDKEILLKWHPILVGTIVFCIVSVYLMLR